MKPDITCLGFKNFLGLMFQTKKKTCLLTFGKSMCWNLHTWFCFYPLDIYFLDKDSRIVEKTSMKPWTTYKSKKKTFYALEIPAGAKKYTLGQKVDLGNA